MLEPPDVPLESLRQALRAGWGFDALALEFLPLGNDSSAWVYRARGAAGDGFAKLKRGPLNLAALDAPRYLHDNGLPEVVAALPARGGQLFVALDGYHLVLYPFIEGENAMQVGLSAAQWAAFGDFLRRLHAFRPDTLSWAGVRREDFAPPWLETARAVMDTARGQVFDHPRQSELAEFLRGRSAEIERILARAEGLGARLRAEPPEFVLCHADIHTANLLVGAAGDLHVVDWDGLIFAPKERDLMFVPRQEDAPEAWHFARGYPRVALNLVALAYYAYEWVVQEIGDFGQRVYFDALSGAEMRAGDETRIDALRGMMQLFQPGDVVDAAQRAWDALP